MRWQHFVVLAVHHRRGSVQASTVKLYFEVLKLETTTRSKVSGGTRVGVHPSGHTYRPVCA